jgi:glutathione synthase/RimK-type ligase-like ATP-grasp enzyme
MLLIVTNREDLTADWLILELQQRGTPYIRFNTEDYPQDTAIHWNLVDPHLEIGQRNIASAQIDAVWFRRPVPPRLRPGLAADDAAWAAREATEALDGFWRTLNARWVSPPAAIRLADSKPLQLADAAALGFDVPDTEITSSVARVRALMERSQDGVICKPLRSGQVRKSGQSLLFTSIVKPSQVDNLGDEPHLFQARVAKRYDIRVTVIGDDIFATRIEQPVDSTPDVDWRRVRQESLSFTPETLPDDVAERCLSLVRHYGLAFSAIDLARRMDGGYAFFELNPNGQWAFVEQRTGQPLRARLADLLTP